MRALVMTSVVLRRVRNCLRIIIIIIICSLIYFDRYTIKLHMMMMMMMMIKNV